MNHKSMNKKSRSRESKPETQQVIIETPANSRNKYKFNEETGRMKLSKVLPEGMMFPYDFGFIPGTKGDDGDPLDVLVLADEPMFPGCEVECRLVRVIKAKQKEKGTENRNDRIVAVAEGSVLYAGFHELADIEPGVLSQIEQFFTNYQKARDIEFKVLKREGSRSALQLVQRASQKAA
jgi:inorganic pyrophosphatase